MKVRRTILKIRLNKTVAALATGALLLVAVPVTGLATAGAAAKPVYVIGYEGPLSGSSAQYGLNEIGGTKLAINNANASGKLPFTLKVASFDDQGSGTLSPAQAQAAIATKSLVAVVGPAFSGATKNAMPYYSAAGVPVVSPSATAAGLTTGLQNNDFMRVLFGDSVQGAADANFLIKTKGAKSLAVIDDGSFYGAGVAQIVALTAKAAGVTPTTSSLPQSSTCSGTASTTQYAAAATALVAAKPDALFYGGYYCDFGLLLGALYSAGFKGMIMSGDGSAETSLISGTTPKEATNNVYLSAANAGTNANLSGALGAQFKKLTGIDPATALYSSQAYDATMMVIAALQAALVKVKGASLDVLRTQIKTQLHTMTYKGVTGIIKFNTYGDLTRAATGSIGIYQITNATYPTKTIATN